MNPQNSNYDFILTNATPEIATPNKSKRIIQVAIAAAVLLIIFGGLYSVIFSGKNSDSDKLLPVYGSLLDIKAISEQGIKETKNAGLVNQATTNAIITSSQLNDLNKFINKKQINNKKAMAAYRNQDYIKSLADAKQNSTYDKSYSEILSNRIDLHKQIIVSTYDNVNNINIKKMLEEFNSQINTANGAQTMPN